MNQMDPRVFIIYVPVFLALYICDGAAIFALYVPYLKTFLRYESKALVGTPIGPRINIGTRQSLRASVAFWDAETSAIWLRPNGLQILQMQGAVAKLLVDPARRIIVSQEIRFSLAVMIFAPLLAAFIIMSSSQVTDERTAGIGGRWGLLALLAVVIVVGGLINVRLIRDRLAKVIEEALVEIELK